MVTYSDFKLDEAEYILKVQDLLDEELAVADSLDFPDEFKKLNAERIKYDVLFTLGVYPQYHSYATNNIDYLPKDIFFNFALKYFKQQPDLYGLSAYITYMDNIASADANKHIIDWDSRDFTVNVLSYIQEKITDPKLKDILLTKRVNYYLTASGLDESEEFVEVFRKNVKDKYFLEEIEEMLKRLKSLQKGNKSYPFKFKDLDSKTVSIDSLKGKYIYMCVWASWCPACRNDLLAFDKMQTKYKDKNIEFVSLSIDMDKRIWKRSVKGLEMSGLQLNYDRDNDFIEKYMLYYLPRFILLDQEGHIYESRAIHASEEGAEAYLNALPSL
jgi:thiol-disulfide isomerase/thioredoxin